MKKTIWKFQLEETSVQHIQMPVGHEILSLQMQNGVPCIWALVQPDRPKLPICIEIYGTGHDILPELPSEKRTFVGTYQTGAFVFHVFTKI